MVYVTGDIHGELSVLKRRIGRLKKGDTLIICGDFGFVFDGSDKEKKRLSWIGRRKFNILFVEGVHDNINLISKYPEEEWGGGRVHTISGNLRHLCRGEVFTIEGMRILAFGGGECSSLEAGVLEWWDSLLPGEELVAETKSKLESLGNELDYIVTHRPSRRIKLLLTGHETDVNILDAFFDEIRKACRHKGWFFGELHIDRFIPPSEAALFHEVLPLGGTIGFSNTHAAKRKRKKC